MVLSNPYRLPMRWSGNEDGTTITGACLYDEYLFRLGLMKKWGRALPEYSLTPTQIFCLNEIYNNMKWEFAMMNLKNIQFLNFISHKHKIKTIIFNVFEQGVQSDNEIILTKKLYETDKDELFFVYPKSLFEISNNEWKVDTYSGGFTNHLSKFAHETLSNIVVNYFNNTNLSEVFQENLFHTDKTENFIYE